MAERTTDEPLASQPRWRRFAREVGSIVLGVLIALAIGEVADAVRWRVRLDRSEAAMRVEMSGNRFNLAERWLLRPCIKRRLDQIEGLLDAARGGATLPLIVTIGRLPNRVSERAAFDVALSEGVLLHTDLPGARDAALAYAVTVDDFAQAAANERAAWTTLALIEQSPGAVDGDTLLTLRQALIQARASAEAMATTIERSDKLLRGRHVPIEFARYGSAAGLAAALKSSAVCRSLN